MPHYAAFHMGLHCLPNYPFRGFRSRKGSSCTNYIHHYVCPERFNPFQWNELVPAHIIWVGQFPILGMLGDILVSLNLLKTILSANNEDTDQTPAGPNMDPNRL